MRVLTATCLGIITLAQPPGAGTRWPPGRTPAREPLLDDDRRGRRQGAARRAEPVTLLLDKPRRRGPGPPGRPAAWCGGTCGEPPAHHRDCKKDAASHGRRTDGRVVPRQGRLRRPTGHVPPQRRLKGVLQIGFASVVLLRARCWRTGIVARCVRSRRSSSPRRPGMKTVRWSNWKDIR